MPDDKEFRYIAWAPHYPHGYVAKSSHTAWQNARAATGAGNARELKREGWRVSKLAVDAETPDA